MMHQKVIRSPEDDILHTIPWIRRAGRDFLLEELSASRLTAAHGTPLFVFSSRQLDENVADLRAAFGDDTDLFVSYKACLLRGILARIHSAGIGAEVCTRFELALARSLNIPADRICWNAVALDEDDVKAALQEPLLWLGLNTLDDIHRFGRAAAASAHRQSVMLRVHPRTTRDGYVARGSKLGFDMNDEALSAALDALANYECLRFEGLHYHIDTMQADGDVAAETLRNLLNDMQRIAPAAFTNMQRVCVGGGLASASAFRRVPGSLAGYAQALREVLKEGGRDIQLCLEPGRYFTSDAACVVTKCLARQTNAGTPWILVDACTNSLVPFENRRFPIAAPASGVPEVMVGDRMSTNTSVIGQVAGGPRLGDLLLILEAGAYTLSTGQDFMYGSPLVVLVEGGDASILRMSDTPQTWSNRVGGRPAVSRRSFFENWAAAEFSETGETMRVGNDVIVHRWEASLMEAFADRLRPNGKDILEIGFGMGLSAKALHSHGPASHLIVEPHPGILQKALLWRRRARNPERIRFHQALWQDFLANHMSDYDIIFYDGYSQSGAELADMFRLTAQVADRLRPDGQFAFFCMTPTLGADIQSILLLYFDEISVLAVRDLVPTADFEALGVTDTMIVPVASRPRPCKERR